MWLGTIIGKLTEPFSMREENRRLLHDNINLKVFSFLFCFYVNKTLRNIIKQMYPYISVLFV